MSEKIECTAQKAFQEMMTCVLNSLDIAIFVSDMSTDEILYVNTALRRMLGGDPLIGRICWEALMGRRSKCDWCPITYLLKNPGKSYWWAMNAGGRRFLVHDNIIPWVNGRLTHMQYIVDITEHQQT